MDALKIPKICFGTNITFPLLLGNGLRKNLKELLKFLLRKLKRTSKAVWGINATPQATQTLIPLARIAVKYGITAFDCSRAYGGSERRLSIALEKYERSDIFIITKIDDKSQFLERVEECFATSLKELRMDYVDLLLLHWPVDYPHFPNENMGEGIPVFVKSWKILEQIYKSGKTKAIGVANFNIKHLKILKKYAEFLPMANEFECHPLATRPLLNEYCRENGIQVLAYAALCAMDKRLQKGELINIASKHKKSIAQVILKWHIQSGRVPIFGTTKIERIKEYGNLDFELSEQELNAINNYNLNYRAFPASEKCDFTKNIWIGYENYKDNCPDEE
ncbi:MAG: aldo/keto reductase [Fibromonadales bacterium]|nr:aldo/keto reductase [Fibromonadales bacterium]